MRNIESDEIPTIREDGTKVGSSRKPKFPKELRDDMDSLIGSYMLGYTKQIKEMTPYCDKAIVYRNMAGPLKHFGLEKMKKLLNIYLASDNKFWKQRKWSILTFLSMDTLNQLETEL